MVILKKNFILALVLAVCLSTTGCVKEGGVSPKVLEGTWDLTFYQGIDRTEDNIYWEFEDDGDFTFHYDGDSYAGDWEWNSDKTEIDITYTDSYGDTYNTEFEVEVLDKETLEGDWSYSSYKLNLEFVRR